ncbi:MAG: helix-turn-helix transcriptional regulator [Eubacteriales bacterium]
MEKRLKELRKARRMTQDVLGCEMNISQQNISRYEQDTSVIPIDMLIKFSGYYQVSTDYILGISNIKSIAREQEDFCANQEYEDFLQVYFALNIKDREVVWSLMSKLRSMKS